MDLKIVFIGYGRRAKTIEGFLKMIPFAKVVGVSDVLTIEARLSNSYISSFAPFEAYIDLQRI